MYLLTYNTVNIISVFRFFYKMNREFLKITAKISLIFVIERTKKDFVVKLNIKWFMCLWYRFFTSDSLSLLTKFKQEIVMFFFCLSLSLFFIPIPRKNIKVKCLVFITLTLLNNSYKHLHFSMAFAKELLVFAILHCNSCNFFLLYYNINNMFV